LLNDEDIAKELERRERRRQYLASEREAGNDIEAEPEEQEDFPLPTTKAHFDRTFMQDKIFYLNIDTLTWRWEKCE
jgi:hypothetical protein